MTVEAAAPQHATGSGLRRWAGSELPAAARYPAGRCQQPGSLPPRTEVQDGRQDDILRDRGGNPDGKRKSMLCGDPRGSRGRKPRTLPTSPKTRKARRHRDAEAAKEEGPTAESKLTEAAEAPAATSGPGCGGRGPQSFGDPGGRARGSHPGPHQLQTQNPAAPRLPRPPRRPRQAQKRPVPRPETLAPNSDQTVAVTVRRSAHGKKYCLTTTYVYVCDSLCPFVHTSLSYTNLFQIGSNDIIAEEKGCGVIMGGRRWENGNSDFVGKYLMYLPSTLPVSPGF